MALIVLGNGEFGLIGTPKWIPGGLNQLDALELVYQGAYNKLTTFRGTLSKWLPATLDNAMFLESFPDDGDPIKPKVTLRFIGCKGGVLPVGKRDSGNLVQSATFSVGDSFSVDVVALMPTASYEWLSEEEGAGGIVPNPTADPVVKRWKATHTSDFVGAVPTNATEALSYFQKIKITTTQSEEIVPGKYWLNKSTTAKTLQ